MSDGEDDFMCEEEEDYGLVSIIIVFLKFYFTYAVVISAGY